MLGDSFGSSRTDLSIGNLLRCRRCGFRFSQVRPSEGELGRLYRDLDVAAYEAESEGRVRTANRHLKILREYHPQSGRVLDVGCASGKFLHQAFEEGWETFGVEPSTGLFKVAEVLLKGKARIQNVTLQEATLEPNSFDALTMFDVLEHVPDPIAFLRLSSSLLRPGGHLLLNVPDPDSWPARAFGRRWPLILPEHLNYFNRRSFSLAAANAGLQIVRFTTRPVTFSLRYIAHRLEQHRLPMASQLSRILSHSPLGSLTIPIYMGELCAVLVKP